MAAIQETVVTPIHEVYPKVRLGPLALGVFGKEVGDPIKIGRFEWSTVVTIREDDCDAHGGEVFMSKLLAIIERADPETIIIGRNLSHSYIPIRRVSGVDINTDLLLKNRFFYQE